MKKQELAENFFRKRSLWRISISKTVRVQIFIIVGVSLAAILTGILGEFFVVNADLRAFLLDSSSNLAIAVIIFLFLERGIKSLHPITETYKLPIHEIIEEIRNTRQSQRIRILDTFTALTDNYPEFKDAAMTAIKKRTKIDVLLIHPYSIGAQKRAEQLKDPIDIAQEVNKNLRQFYAFCSGLEAKDKPYLEIRLYSALPSISLYHCNDWAYISLFPIGERGDESPNLKVPVDNPFGSYVDKTFEQLWHGTPKAPTIQFEEHMLLRLDVGDRGPSSLGYHFAYDVTKGGVDRSQCFILLDHNPFLETVYHEAKVREKICFYVDGKKWRARPHILNARNTQDMDEYNRALDLIEQRYGWKKGTIGRDPEIACFKDIIEIEEVL